MSEAVAYLFTDVEGSTRLWERRPAAMRAAIERHGAIVEGVVAAHGGTEVRARAEGDSAFLTFPGAGAACAAAVDLQRALAAEPWKEGITVRVRAAIHAGAAAGTARYYGPVVNRTAHLRSLAHGGQVVLSGAAAEAARDGLPPDAALVDLGVHRLKGLTEPEHVWQLVAAGLPSDFPPLRSPDVARHNLPESRSPLVGREQDLRRVGALLDAERLVTLTGTGGVGKTSLAVEAAAARVAALSGGVWMIELGALSSVSDVAPAIGAALGVREEPGRPPEDAVIDALRDADALLLLDNCEHLVDDAAGLVARLLRSCPRLRVLATSREPLGLPGEAVWIVPPLAAPPAGATDPWDVVAAPAGALFEERARRAHPGFAVDAASAAAVAEICRRLDGVPLALEMVAARVAAVRLEDILDDLPAQLAAGEGPAGRQETLWRTIAWSHDLLEETEQALFRRLGLFAGGFTLESAEHVCAGDPVDELDVLDLLTRLVAKSLVALDESAGGGRYRMLETLRQFAAARLGDAGEHDALRDRHLAWFHDMAEEAVLEVRGPSAAAALDLLETEHENLAASLSWGLEGGGDRAVGMHLAERLGFYWSMRGHWSEGRRWIDAALGAPGGPEESRAELAGQAGQLAYRVGDYDEARRRFAEALAAWEAVGTGAPAGSEKERTARLGTAEAQTWLGEIERIEGHLEAAQERYERGLETRRALGSQAGIAQSLNQLGMLAYVRGDFSAAGERFAESLEICRALGDVPGAAQIRINLGAVLGLSGDYDAAAGLLRESISIHRELGDRRGAADALNALAEVTHLHGGRGAEGYALEAAELYRELGSESGLAEAEEILARIRGER